MQLHNQPTNLLLQEKVKKLRKDGLFLCEAERASYLQQAKNKYLKNYDRGTKFFHAIVKRNSKWNYIASINREDGSLTSSQQEVAEEFI